MGGLDFVIRQIFWCFCCAARVSQLVRDSLWIWICVNNMTNILCLCKIYYVQAKWKCFMYMFFNLCACTDMCEQNDLRAWCGTDVINIWIVNLSKVHLCTENFSFEEIKKMGLLRAVTKLENAKLHIYACFESVFIFQGSLKLVRSFYNKQWMELSNIYI